MATTRLQHTIIFLVLLALSTLLYLFPSLTSFRLDSFSWLRQSTPPIKPTPISLDQEMHLLREKVAQLSWQLLISQKQIEELSQFRAKFSSDKMPFAIPATILAKRDSAPQKYSFVVDRGSKDGVTAGCVVVSGHSLIGRIWEVGTYVSRALYITDPAMQVGVILVAPVDSSSPEIEEIKYGEGLCVGKGKFCQLQLVEKDYQSWTGADILTSGFQNDYPAGLFIGSVKLTGAAKKKEEPEQDSLVGEEIGLFWNLRIVPKDLDKLLTVLILPKK